MLAPLLVVGVALVALAEYLAVVTMGRFRESRKSKEQRDIDDTLEFLRGLRRAERRPVDVRRVRRALNLGRANIRANAGQTRQH